MKILNLANESIAFQSGSFFKDLTLIIKDIRASGLRTREDVQRYYVRIEKCIYEHTGITTSVQFVQAMANAFVLIPALGRSNVLNRGNFNKFLEKHFDADKLSFFNLEKKGWIDPATSKVGGAFSEIVFKAYIGDPFLLDRTYSPEAAAAVILHEVGHAYTFIQFLADTIVVNGVLQRTYAELTNGNPDKKVKLILTKAAEDMRLENRDWLEPVVDKTDGELAYRVLVTAVAVEPRLMDNKRYFTYDAAEEFADIFAARHGAGRAIVELRASMKNTPRQSYDLMVSTGLTLFGVLTAVTAGAAGGIFLAIMGGVMMAMGMGQAANALDPTSFKQLAIKMRNQSVERLKLSNVPKEDITEIIEGIDVINSLIRNHKEDIDQPLIVKFFDMLRRGKMEARASREYTDRLEAVAANDLFVRAAELGLRK